MTVCKVLEIFRLAAVDGASDSGPLTGDPATLLIYNPLQAPIYIRLSAGTPGPTSYDLACPGQAIMSWPIGAGSGVLSAVVDYPGAVPAGDDGLEAIIRTSEATLPAFVGPLA